MTNPVSHFSIAADPGLASGQSNLGLVYYNGEGVPQDYAEAARWLRLAAAQRDADAQYNLGFMCAIGRGAPKDFVQGHVWLNLAALQGNQMATGNRDHVSAAMTPDQIAEARRLAREWKPTPP